MLQYFLGEGSLVLSEPITRNFSPVHIAWLVTVLLLIAGFVPIYRKQSLKFRTRMKQVLVVVMVTGEIAIWIWKAVNGIYSLRDTLPLHLCNISIFLEFFAVFGKKTDLLKEFAYSLSMPAALAAIITPGWYYPCLSFPYIQAAASHSLQLLIPVLFVWGDRFQPDYRRLPKCFLMLLGFAGAAALADIVFDSNYMFLCYVPPDTPLQYFEQVFGHPGYIFLEVALIGIIWVVLYLPRILKNRKVK